MCDRANARASNPFFHHSHAAAQHLAQLRKLVGKRAAALTTQVEGREMTCVSKSSALSMKSRLRGKVKATA
jgi:hypothetical protein